MELAFGLSFSWPLRISTLALAWKIDLSSQSLHLDKKVGFGFGFGFGFAFKNLASALD